MIVLPSVDRCSPGRPKLPLEILNIFFGASTFNHRISLANPGVVDGPANQVTSALPPALAIATSYPAINDLSFELSLIHI